MSTLELYPNVYETSPSTRQIILSIARGILLVLLAIMYSGTFPFLRFASPYLLYAVYPAILAPILLCLSLDKQAIQNLRSILPYLIWIIFYSLWGVIVSQDKDLVLPYVVRMLIQNVLVLSAVATALADRQNLAKLAGLIQVVVIINLIIQIWETIEPQLVATIAYTLDPYARAFNVLRPAGLWSNPNEAAFAFLFALLLSYWARGPLAWIGRIAAIVGIYLTVSRSGIYLLLLCGLLYLIFKLRTASLTPGRMAVLASGLALVICLGWIIAYRVGTLSVAISENWNISRLLDVRESDSDGSRFEITSLAASYALDGPLYGYGIFALQGTSASNLFFQSFDPVGPHNVYITVWGETGIFGVFIYLVVLGIGLRRLLKADMVAGERLIMALMWMSYLLIGLVYHNQFTSVTGMIYVGLLYHLPQMLQATRLKGSLDSLHWNQRS